MITKNTKIEDIVKMDDRMMDFFNENKIDYCCNGYMTVAEVAKSKNKDEDTLKNSIEKQLDILRQDKKTDSKISIDDFKKW